MLIQTLGTNFSEILIRIQTFSFEKMHLKMSSAKWHPFCPGLNVLTGFYWTHCNNVNKATEEVLSMNLSSIAALEVVIMIKMSSPWQPLHFSAVNFELAKIIASEIWFSNKFIPNFNQNKKPAFIYRHNISLSRPSHMSHLYMHCT